MRIKILLVLLNIKLISSLMQIKAKLDLCEKGESIINLNYLERQCQRLPKSRRLECEDFLNDLNLISLSDDKFFYVNSPNGKVIIYSDKEDLYKPTCTQIDEIWVPEEVRECTDDLIVYFNKNKDIDKDTGYLTKEGILRKNSKTIECTNKQYIYHLENIVFIRQERNVNLVQRENISESFGFDVINEDTFIFKIYESMKYFTEEYLEFNYDLKLFEKLSIILAIFLVAFHKSKKQINKFKLFIKQSTEEAKKKLTLKKSFDENKTDIEIITVPTIESKEIKYTPNNYTKLKPGKLHESSSEVEIISVPSSNKIIVDDKTPKLNNLKTKFSNNDYNTNLITENVFTCSCRDDIELVAITTKGVNTTIDETPVAPPKKRRGRPPKKLIGKN